MFPKRKNGTAVMTNGLWVNLKEYKMMLIVIFIAEFQVRSEVATSLMGSRR